MKFYARGNLRNNFKEVNMKVLKLKSKEEDVSTLQTALVELGWKIGIDGSFSGETLKAVKDFQTKNKLGADGVVGRNTWNALITQTRDKTFDVQTMEISQAGLDFIFRHEAMDGVSEYFHHPSMASGVTIGAGYDFKQRSMSEVRETMTKIGLTPAQVNLACDAVGLTGQAAKNFCSVNKKAIKLTKEQEIQLLNICVKPYVNLVKRYMKIQLSQVEFDAMVDFAYNPGKVLNRVCAYLNQHDYFAAMDLVDDIIKSGAQVLPGLVKRRFDEKHLFVNSKY